MDLQLLTLPLAATAVPIDAPATPVIAWVAFNLFILAMLALDLGVFHRKSHEVGFREAAAWSGVWVGLALIFNLGVYHVRGGTPALEFLTGYLIEKSLSVDNIFVFALVFSAFAVPARYQHRVLFWGILGALVFRAIFIAAGAALLERFHWIIYVFGAFLILTGVKMALYRDQRPDLTKNPVVRAARRLLPVTPEYVGDRFVVRGATGWAVTPLFLVLLLIETTDLVFAVDSIPAIFAVTRDPFIVYTSNVFAILGLRSLYFLLAGLMERFVHLKLGLAAVLVFVGAKMTLVEVYKIPANVSLLVIALLLGASIAGSWWTTRAAQGPSGREADAA